MIVIEQLAKSYGSRQVLQNINLTFAQGGVYGIVGENGAGKTTLFRCIAGLESYEGTITCATGILKNSLGYLPTEAFFFAHITGREYLQMLCNARQKPLPDLQASNIFELPLDQYVSSYSTGMKKKLGIMAILLQGNDYFILDEPYNGVDIQSNLLITEIILKLKSLRKTILISSHIFSTLQDTCDEIYWLQTGSFLQKATHEGFEAMGEAMKQNTIGDKMARLDSFLC